MGIFGTYGAFQGLGKPSIKLEFEDNESLVNFSKRMQEGEAAPAVADPDLANFDQKRLDEAVANHNTIGWGMSDGLPDGWTRLYSDAAPDGFDVMVKGSRPELRLGTYGWQFRSASDARLVAKEKKLKATKGGELEGITIKDFYTAILSDAEKITPKHFSYQLLDKEFGKDKDGVYDVVTPVGTVKFYKSSLFERNHHILNHIEDNFNVLKPTLANPTIVFEGENKGFETISFVKPFNIRGKNKIIMFSAVEPKTYRLKTIFEPETVDENYIWRQYTKGGEKRLYTKKSVLSYFEPDTPQNDSLGDSVFPFEVVNILLPCNITENGAKSFVDGEKNSLDGYGDFYTVRDMRKRSRKEPGDVATNKNLQFTKDNDRKINNFDRSLYELTNGVNSWNYGEKLKDTHWRTLTVKYNSDNGKYFTTIQLFFPYTLRRDLDKPTFTGYAGDVDVDVDLNNLYNYSYYVDSRNYVDRQKLEGFVKDDYYKTLLIEAIKSGYKQLQQRLINAKNSRLANTPSNIAEAERLIKYYKMLYSDPSKYDLLDKAYGGGFKNISNKLEKFLGEGGLALDGLGAPGDTYIITDTRTRARKDLEDTAALKKYDIRKFSGEELRKMQSEDPLLYEQIKADLGRTANPAIYNNNDIMECRGLVPTYTILDDYSSFFEQAKTHTEFAGFGLDDTLKLITDICRKHWKDCAKIAQHLKGDCKLQSAFNLWHWMRYNIRYEYDREGREEVRTPLRVWADRDRGVDCDCLSVFAYCVLKCMGYNPAFELVAFRNKPQYSHIFINLDDIVIDRVWFIFNSRPPMVTKSTIYRINDINDLGKLF